LIGDNAYVTNRAKKNIDPYVSAEIRNNKLILQAGKFPEKYYTCVDYEIPVGHNSVLVPLQKTVIEDNENFSLTELLPPYRIYI
jgi:hypothetical protein